MPAELFSSDHYWAQVNQQAWAFFRGDLPLAILPGNQLLQRLKAAYEEAALFDVDDRLNEIEAPTLVVRGRHDFIMPLEEIVSVHESIPGSSLLVLEQSGHGVEGVNEGIFWDVVIRFLSGLAA